MFANALRVHAAALDATVPANRWGIVQSVDTSTMTAKVMVQPENVLSGWLPVVSPMAGSGWGLLHPPVTGQQVLLVPDAGDHESYIIIGATWNQANMPPAGSAAGEFWLQSASGAKVQLLNNGHVVIRDGSGSSITMTNDNHVTFSSQNVTFTCQQFTVNASAGVTMQTPFVNISEEVDVAIGPIKVNGVTVVVP